MFASKFSQENENVMVALLGVRYSGLNLEEFADVLNV